MALDAPSIAVPPGAPEPAAPAATPPAVVPAPAPVVATAPISPPATPPPASPAPASPAPAINPHARPKDLTEAREQVATLSRQAEAAVAEAASLKAVVASHATQRLAAADPKVRAAVLAIAGEHDPAAQLRALDALASQGLTGSAAVPPAPPGATTTAVPPGTAPLPAAMKDPDVAVFEEFTRAEKAGQHLLAAQIQNRDYRAWARGRDKSARPS